MVRSGSSAGVECGVGVGENSPRPNVIWEFVSNSSSREQQQKQRHWQQQSVRGKGGAWVIKQWWVRVVGTASRAGVEWDVGVGVNTPIEIAGCGMQGQGGSDSLQPTL